MTTDQQRKILEAAAKACGACKVLAYTDDGIVVQWSPILRGGQLWNTIDNSRDTASMCAKLDIGVTYHSALGFLVCRKSIDVAAVAHYKDHDNSRLKAWMYAATMVAAKIGGYENDV